MSIDERGRCRPVNQVSEDHSDGIPHTWKCCSKCKPLTDKEVAIILEFKSGFEADMQQVHKLLDTSTYAQPEWTDKEHEVQKSK